MIDNPNKKLLIALATCLESDDWPGVKECNRNIISTMSARTDECDVMVCMPPFQNTELSVLRGLVRGLVYPAIVQKRISSQPGPDILHVTDHFHAFLASKSFPSV